MKPTRKPPQKLFLSGDSAAVAVGADRIADTLQTLIDAMAVSSSTPGADTQKTELIRTGSRGIYWLEPAIEVETPAGRIAYGPLTDSVVSEVFEDLCSNSNQHPLCQGLIDQLPWLQNQHRLLFKNCGKHNPLELDFYTENEGLKGWEKALTLEPLEIIREVQVSGLRGRGGAGFPAGIKWQSVYEAVSIGNSSAAKYVVCNADEGDSGTFADRMIMEGDPFLLIEGMLIAARAVGAAEGYIYLRSEYPAAEKILSSALATAYASDLLGEHSRSGFDLHLFVGAGAYICGEETSLLESLEGKPGLVRAKPPLPAVQGLFSQPTLVHNVLTLCALPGILREGGNTYRELGTRDSPGSMPFQLSGNVKRGGLIETGMGVSIRRLVEDFGGGTATGRPIGAVQVGGPLGAYLPENLLDLALDFEALGALGYGPGHGGIVVFDDSFDPLRQAIYAFQFCRKESCGKCTPCRIGSVRGAEALEQFTHREKAGDRVTQIRIVEELCDLMQSTSLCAMGSMTPIPVTSLMQHFPESFSGESQ